MKWNHELKRYESDRVYKEKWTPDDEPIEREEVPVQYCRKCEPPEWQKFREWLWDYSKNPR